MMASEDREASLPDLIRLLVREIRVLFYKEIELAKAEASDNASNLMGGVESILAGGVLALSALVVLLWALSNGIAALLMEWGMAEMSAQSLSGLIVGLLTAITAFILIKKGINKIQSTNWRMEKTTESVKRDAAAAKELM